jgi:hypothetical protein
LPWLVLLLCFCLLLFRDVQRAGWLLDSDLLNLLKLDGVYFSLALIALLLAIKTGHVGISGVLGAMSLPALFGLIHHNRSTRTGSDFPFMRIDASFWRAVWSCSRWALPGVLINWMYSNGYWFYLNSSEGKLAVATLAASRLAFTPIGLMVQGWSGYFRPVFSRLEHQGAHAEKQAIIRRQNWICAGVALGYAALLSLLGMLEPRFLPAYLRGAVWLQYVWAWGLYFAVQWVRTVRLTSRLANAAGFRAAFQTGAFGCAVFYLLLLPSPWLTHSPLVCPVLLIVAELLIFISLSEKPHALVAQTV